MPETVEREEFMVTFNRLVVDHLGSIVVAGSMLLGGCVSFAYMTLLGYVERVVAAELIATQSQVSVSGVGVQLVESVRQAKETHGVLVDWRIQSTEDMGKLRTDVEVVRSKVETLEQFYAREYNQ